MGAGVSKNKKEHPDKDGAPSCAALQRLTLFADVLAGIKRETGDVGQELLHADLGRVELGRGGHGGDARQARVRKRVLRCLQ